MGAVVLTLALITANKTIAQEAAKDLAQRAVAESQVLTAFRDMERSLSEIDHFVTYGIVATTGGWGVLEFVNNTDYTNSYVVRGTVADVQIVAARANAAIQRSGHATEEHKDRAARALELLETLYETAHEVSDALTAEDYPLAREIYRDHGQDAYESALIEVQAGTVDLERRLGATLLELMIALP